MPAPQWLVEGLAILSLDGLGEGDETGHGPRQ